MNSRKFDWPIALIIALVVQHLLYILFLYLDFPSSEYSFYILVFVIALLGGLVGCHFYIRHNLHFGGICGALYFVLNRLYYGYDLFNTNVILTILLAYLAGYVGALLYYKQFHRIL